MYWIIFGFRGRDKFRRRLTYQIFPTLEVDRSAAGAGAGAGGVEVEEAVEVE